MRRSRADTWESGKIWTEILNLEKWTHGFEELKKRVQDYPPDKVSEITWLPEEQIIDADRMYGKSKPASIQWGVAPDQAKECMPTLHAIMAMWAVTGNINVLGNVFRTHFNKNIKKHDSYYSVNKRNAEYEALTSPAHDYHLSALETIYQQSKKDGKEQEEFYGF